MSLWQNEKILQRSLWEKRGGKARLVKMTSEERKRIARKGAQARWAKAKQPKTK